MNESNFIGMYSTYYEGFGIKAKEKLDAAAALQKVVYQQPAKGKADFQAGYPRKFNHGRGGSRQNNSGPGKYRRRLEALQHQQRDLPDD